MKKFIVLGTVFQFAIASFSIADVGLGVTQVNCTDGKTQQTGTMPCHMRYPQGKWKPVSLFKPTTPTSSEQTYSVYCKGSNGVIKVLPNGPCNGTEVSKADYDNTPEQQGRAAEAEYDKKWKTESDAKAEWQDYRNKEGIGSNGKGSASNDLNKDHKGGEYGDGRYSNGHGRQGDTEIVNMTAEMTKSRVSDVTTAVVSSAGSRAQTRVQQMGGNATQDDFVRAETSVAKTNANSLIGSASVKMALGATQAWRTADHSKAIKELEAANKFKTLENERLFVEYKRDLANCAANPNCTNSEKIQAKIDDLKEGEKNRQTNYEQEKARQKQIAIMQGQIAGNTIAEAANEMMLAANIKKAAKTAEELQAANKGAGTYAFNSGSVEGEGNTPPPNVDAISTDGAALGSTQESSTGFDDDSDPFAPENLNPGAEGGPAPGTFAQNPPGLPGSGSSTGMGGAAGTSSKGTGDDGKNQETPSKSQAGGNYASEQNGYRARGGSGFGGTGVGKDPNFLDMLKSLLPGEEKVAAKAEENPTSRDLASDNAAVLPRNANIFDAISKRYDKKSKEGSVSSI